MMAGLQGAGKTTTTAKLAGKLKVKGKKAACWLPVMSIVRQQSNSCRSTEKSRAWKFFPWETNRSPVDIAKAAIEHAQRISNNVVILDTAGRLHVDEDMMEELDGDQRNMSRWHQTILGSRCDDRSGCGECGRALSMKRSGLTA